MAFKDDDDRDDRDDDDRDDDDRDDDRDDDDRDDEDFELQGTDERDDHDHASSDFDDEGGHGDFADPLFYVKNTPKVGSPDTPGRVRPDKKFEMKVRGDKLEMPDGEDVEFWFFEDRLADLDDPPIRPSSPIRVTEGDIVHVTIKPAKRQHTIHLHGIEIDTHNDGVGHTSFEVTGEYTYQWRAGAPYSPPGGPPPTRGAGTYVYHCHVNTTLHYHMGMWGPVVIDPIEGPGYAFHNGPQYDVDAERFWAAGDVDPTWRDLGHQAGLEGGDAGLNDFNPIYFDISGTFQPMRRRRLDPNAVIDDPAIATEGEVGGLPILIRYVNAAYTQQTVWFQGIDDGSLDVQVIASDGRAFDDQAPNFAKPYPLTAPLHTTTAERFDFLVTPLRRGTSIVEIDNLNWITGASYGKVRTTITGV